MTLLANKITGTGFSSGKKTFWSTSDFHRSTASKVFFLVTSNTMKAATASL